MNDADIPSSDKPSPDSANEFPREGRLVGIDFGTVRIGVAITDPGRRMASPLENYTRRGIRQDERYFRELAEGERVAGFVVGLPVHTSGDESKKSLQAREFGTWLGRITSRPVTYFDERYTTAEAEQQLIAMNLSKKRRKARLDMLAAQIILSAYLESGGDDNKEPGALDD